MEDSKGEEKILGVKLLQATPLEVAVIAGRKCVANKGTYDGDAQAYLLRTIKRKHLSVVEHLVYTFDISGISRALLQEIARHRIASLSVESTRWALSQTLGQALPVLPFDAEDIPVETWEKIAMLWQLSRDVVNGLPNDIGKYFLLECYPTNLVWTMNARELMHVFGLRMKPDVLKEFQGLCAAMYDVLPRDHRPLYWKVIYGETSPKKEEDVVVCLEQQ